MKLALINPRGTRFFKSLEFQDFWQDAYDVSSYRKAWSGIGTGLLVLAALTPEDVEIQLIDDNFEEIPYREGFDIAAISAMTHQVDRAYEIADRFREEGVYVVIGGIHATVMPQEAAQHADTVVSGEAELVWPGFIEDYRNGNPWPFYRSRPGQIVDIGQSPIPRYELLKPDHYCTLWPQVTRGCPHDCEFCVASNVYGSHYRSKTVERVIEELEKITSIWQYPTICFADDNMFVKRSFAREIARAVAPLKLSWMAQTDISIGNDDQLLDLIYQAGCEAVYIGLESVSKANLKAIDRHDWKLEQFKKYPQLIENIQDHGIGVHGSFMVGLDHDTPDTFKEIIDFILENRLFGGSISILSPYPGSKTRERLEREGRLLDNPWSDYNGENVTFLPRQLTPEQLQNGLIKIWREIYAPQVQSQKRDHFRNIYKRLSVKKRARNGC